MHPFAFLLPLAVLCLGYAGYFTLAARQAVRREAMERQAKAAPPADEPPTKPHAPRRSHSTG